MGRLVLLVLMLAVSGIIYLLKAGASVVTGKDVNFKDESKKVMEKTASGIHWMNDQWDKAKQKSGTVNESNPMLSASFDGLSATEIIVKIKANPSKYDIASAESIYIEQAVVKMNNRQYDDSIKLVMQLQESDARNFMLKEIEQKRG